jgi:hypothetical protein
MQVLIALVGKQIGYEFAEFYLPQIATEGC